MVFQKVKYKLINNDTGRTIELSHKVNDPDCPAPQNWGESEKTLKRSEKTYGVYTELSKNLVFTKKGADFLREAYFYKDIEADVIMEEYKHYPNQDGYYLNSTGVFDFSDYESDKLTVKVPFKTGGLNALIQSQLKEKFELERLESINGKEIDPINKIDVAVTGRSIFLLSELENANEESTVFSQLGAPRMPNLNVVSNSDTDNVNPTFGDDTHEFGDNPPVVHYFYLENDRDKTITVKVDYSVIVNSSSGGTNNFQPFIKRYNFNDTDYVFQESYILSNPNGDYLNQNIFEGQISIDIDLIEGDCLSFGFSNVIGNTPVTNGNQYFTYNKVSLVVQEDSVFPASQTKAVFIHDAYDKLMQIITGEKGRFKSDFFSTGTFSKMAIALGLWIRGFNDENIEISLSDTIDTTNSTVHTGYTIEEINNVETLVVEDMKYFFQDQTAIKLPIQVDNVERKAAKEFAHSSGLFGYKDPPTDNKYEELMGLDEYNVRTGYTLPITRTDTTYKKESPFRADPTAKELARRKPKLNFPEEDTRYDKSIHLFDLKEGLGLAYEERVWQDDYEVEPTGIYAPENATNLRITPFRNSERHQWFYGSALTKFQDESVRFSNSDGNKALITKKASEVERPENGNVKVSELERPRFVSQWITFEATITFDLLQQIYGKTEVNGREIPNYFFKWEIINEFGKKEYGYLFEFKQKSSQLGQFKILKAY